MPASKTLIIGLTGGIGCGKSEAAAHLKRLGAVHIDADAISRSLTGPGGEALPAIRARFGDDIFHADGTLSREALSAIVFAQDASRRALNEILHPLVLKRALHAIEEARKSEKAAVILDVPLLFEVGWDRYCDECWVLTAPVDVQIERVMLRGLSKEEALARIRKQLPAEEREKRGDIVIRTDRPLRRTRHALTRLYFERVYQVTVRRAVKADTDAIMCVIRQAQAHLKARGVDQWQDGFPTPEVIDADCEHSAAFVLMREGCVSGFACVSLLPEPNYAAPVRRAFHSSEPYATLHRTAIADALRGLGCSRLMFDCCREYAEEAGFAHLRIDTHADNVEMRHILKREGFTESAVILLGNGSERIAFESTLDLSKE